MGIKPKHNISTSKIMHNLNAIKPNQHILNAIVSSNLADSTHSENSTSELDSHANMIVLGNYAFIFETTGRTCNVEPFATELGVAQNVPIVDAAIDYDCVHSQETGCSAHQA